MDNLVYDFLRSNQTILHLGVALLLGALIGVERGWEAREQKAGERIAGIRTFSLVGLLGGVAALMAEHITVWIFPAMLLSLVAITLVSFSQRLEQIRNFSITGTIGLLLTFCYGAIAVAIDPVVAAALAVVTAIVLDNKQQIHGFVNELKEHELDAGLKLLVISVVMLPLLPNEGMGPGGVINPYSIWWMIVLIASVSFFGYFAVRVGGNAKGILFTSVFAGLSSSTALTLHFAKQSQKNPKLSPQLAAGILIACGTMFPRILIYCVIINRELLVLLSVPVLVMALVLYSVAGIIWAKHREALKLEQLTLNQNPLDLSSALVFGILLTIILFLSEVLRNWFGDKGVLWLAATSGIADVDAITLSLTRLSLDTLSLDTAVIGIVIAAMANNLLKSGMALVVGSRALGWRVTMGMSLAMAAGMTTAVFQLRF